MLAQHYEIQQILGEGGMGAVYKAKDRELDRLVALKVIRPELAGNPDILQRFKQEILLSSKVTDRNVIRIYDLGDADGIKFITMEYVEGEDLRTILRSRGKLPVKEAVNIIAQTLSGLAAAHREGIIHRDLKPGNIMRDAQGRVVVMDFGLARSLDSDGMTRTGLMVGTMEYMSPEQAQAKELDPRSDIFTVGLILYELLAGKMPWEAESALASLLKRTQERAIPLSAIDREVPGVLSNIVSKCLERDPKLRYQTASEALTDLETWQGKSAAGSLDFPSIGPWGRDVPWPLIGVILAVLILGSVGFVLRGKLFGPTAKQVVSGPVESVAILPFRNASGDQSLDWLGGSVAEMLSTDIGQSASLRTVSSDRVHQILRDLRIVPDANLDNAALGRLGEFSNADQIVWGQYAKFGDTIRIDATLRDLKQQRSIALKVEARNEKELLGTIDQLAQAIRGNLALSASVVEELKAQAFKPSTKSVQALRYYDEGLQLAREGKNLDAVKQFETSTKEDPEFALAYAKLGETYSQLGYGDKAEEFSRKAVDLSQQLPAQERYRILANEALVSNDNKKAIEYYENLAKVSPNDSGIQLTLAQLYEKTGAYDTSRDYLAKVLAREPKHAEALVDLAHVEGERRNPQGALDYLNRALTLAVELNNDELRSRVLYETGLAYRLLNKPDEAFRNYQESLAIRRRLGQKAGIAQTLAEIGEVENTQGKPDAAVASYKEALQLQREIGDKTYLSHTLLNLGALYSDRGKYDEALKDFKESLEMHRELRNENYEALCLNNIGNVYLATGRYDDALTYFQRALQLLEKLKLNSELPTVLYNLGDTSTRVGQYDQALAYYLRGLEVARNSGDKQFAAIGSYSMGTVFLYQGRYGAAASAQEEALKSYRELQDRTYLMAQALSSYGNTLILLGRNEEARKILDEALSLAREIKNDTYIAQALNLQGERLFYAGDFKASKPLLDQAMRAATRSKDREEMLAVKVSLAELAIKEGQARQAIAELKRLAPEADTLGLRYLSAQCTIDLAEALVSTKDYRAAKEAASTALKNSEKFGFKFLPAKGHYWLGEVLRLTGQSGEAAPQYMQSRQILEEISKEAHTDSFLKRSDLSPIFSASVR